MVQVFYEGRLRFSFPEQWRVVKWDEHPAFLDGLHRVQDTKAVDFVGEHLGIIWLIEVKDFRGYPIENKSRLGKPLADEVADKVRDTIAAMIWACEREDVDEPRDLARFVKAILQRDKETKLPVVLWLEPGRELKAPDRMVIVDQLKKRLKWANVQALVVEMRTVEPETIPGLEVSSLPHVTGGP